MTFNSHSIELSQETFVDKILKRFQTYNSHSALLPIEPHTSLMKEELVLEAEEHRLYQSIIGSSMYLVPCPRPHRTYPIALLSQFLVAPSKSHLMAVQCLLQYITGTKDLKLSIPHSDASEINLEGYSDSDYGNCLDTWQIISNHLFRLNHSTI
jgi:hypothetical protein